jgi:hypothetical protein
MLDVFASCVAVVNRPALADYMGFKYLSHFQRKWVADPDTTDPERRAVTVSLDEMLNRLQPADQVKARELLADPKPRPYWFQPEYQSTQRVLELSTHPIYEMYRIHSASTHGGYAVKLIFADDPDSEDIEPRNHPKNIFKAVMASTRFLLEVCYIRDHWEHSGAGDAPYQELIARISQLG